MMPGHRDICTRSKSQSTLWRPPEFMAVWEDAYMLASGYLLFPLSLDGL